MRVIVAVGGHAEETTVPDDLVGGYANPENDRRQDLSGYSVGHLFSAAYRAEVARFRAGPPVHTGRRKAIADEVDTMVAKFLYYDRKEDEELPVGSIEEALATGEITVADLVSWFLRGLNAGLPKEGP